MALIKGKQLQDTSVSLTKLSGATGSVTLTTGTITTPAANLVISSLPISGSQAANKEYVDSVATGLDIKKSVVAVYRTSVAAAGGTPAISTNSQLDGVDADDVNVYTAITTQAGISSLVLDGITIVDGDRVLIALSSGGTRHKVNGIFVYQGGQLIRAQDADNVTANIGEVSGGMFTFVEQGAVYGDTGWVLSSPNGAISGQTGAAGLYDFTNNPAGLVQLEFTQFSAAGVAEAGVGLTRTGTKFNVNYDDSSIGIDGADALYIKADGVTNAMLLNDYINIIGDGGGNGNIALGGSLTIAGNTGIDTSMTAGLLSIDLDLSELTTVTTIADADFIVTSRATTPANQKITFANLKTLIGAASQLSISAEGATASSLDLDTDTLDFATGQGLTFAATGGAAPGTTNTLTLTVSNNALNVQQSTSYTTAALGNTDITITAAAEVFSVTINGVMLKKTTNWVWPQGANTVVRVTGLPYALEASDEIEITYRVA